jgi:hypothetical protein
MLHLSLPAKVLMALSRAAKLIVPMYYKAAQYMINVVVRLMKQYCRLKASASA